MLATAKMNCFIRTMGDPVLYDNQSLCYDEFNLTVQPKDRQETTDINPGRLLLLLKGPHPRWTRPQMDKAPDGPRQNRLVLVIFKLKQQRFSVLF